jgi:uroporphyrinogen-III synthase
MRALITRPEEDAAKIATLLHARGHETIIAPLLSVRFHDGPEISLDNIQAVLATSANGVRALARRTARRDVPLFAVGPQTEEEARKTGFQTIRNANGDSRALAAATAQWASPKEGALLHAKGAEGDGTLAALLKPHGFDLRSAVVYDVAAARELPKDVRDRISGGALDAALFYSPRSARVFGDCVVNAGLDVGSLIAICISEATGSALAPLAFREIRIAAAPNQDALLECLG